MPRRPSPAVSAGREPAALEQQLQQSAWRGRRDRSSRGCSASASCLSPRDTVLRIPAVFVRPPHGARRPAAPRCRSRRRTALSGRVHQSERIRQATTRRRSCAGRQVGVHQDVDVDGRDARACPVPSCRRICAQLRILEVEQRPVAEALRGAAAATGSRSARCRRAACRSRSP